MTPERWQHIDRLFHSALERPREERAGFLAEVSAGDESVRGEVEALVAAHEQSGEFLDSPAYEIAGGKLTNDSAGLAVGEAPSQTLSPPVRYARQNHKMAGGTRCFVNPNGFPYGGTGNSQANLLLGTGTFLVLRGAIFGGPFNLRSQEYGFFVQDDWKVTDRLTVNMRLRYDLFTPPTEQNGRLSNYDLASRQVIVAHGDGDRLVSTDRNNFGPRVGFAYSIGREKRVVVRGGYGLLYALDGLSA